MLEGQNSLNFFSYFDGFVFVTTPSSLRGRKPTPRHRSCHHDSSQAALCMPAELSPPASLEFCATAVALTQPTQRSSPTSHHQRNETAQLRARSVHPQTGCGRRAGCITRQAAWAAGRTDQRRAGAPRAPGAPARPK